MTESSTTFIAPIQFIFHFACEPKIDNFNFGVFILIIAIQKYDIAKFQVQMDNLSLMEISQGSQNLN